MQGTDSFNLSRRLLVRRPGYRVLAYRSKTGRGNNAAVNAHSIVQRFVADPAPVRIGRKKHIA
jgi:hypothetical protein